jgi:alkylation response protein AidB-like acyl-CoA dehydrogenase
MPDRFTWEQKEFRRQIARFVDEKVIPIAREIDETGRPPVELVRELGELGYLGVKFPEAYGGIGADAPNVYHCLMVEELARGSAGFSCLVAMATALPPSSVFRWGTEALKQAYLVPAMRGEKIGAFSLTEPNAGSDAAAIKTRAVRKGDHWVINGTKIFTSNGTVADYITVAAKTDPTKGIDGISLFLVDTKTPGFRVGQRLKKFCTHCHDTAELVFEDVTVPADHLLGEENAGLRNLLDLLDEDRIMTAATALGTAKAAYRAAYDYAKERQQFGRPISNFQAVKFRLVDMLAKIETAELYVYHAARIADRGKGVRKEAALAKIIVCEAANEVCRLANAVFGGYGLMEEYPVQRYLRDSFFPLIGGGTPDIMRVVVAREIGL